VILEELGRLNKREASEPLIKHALHSGSVKRLELLFVDSPLFNPLENLVLLLNEVLLQSDSLRNSVASHSFLLHLLQEGDSLLLSFHLLLPDQVLPSFCYRVHEHGLEQVVIAIKLKALVQQLGVHLARKAHQPDSFILDLSHEGFAGVALGGDELCEEVLAISFGHGLGLVVKNIGQIVVVLLLGAPDLDERQHEHPRREADPGVRGDSSDVLEDAGVLALDFLEINAQRVKAVVDVIFVSVSSYLIQKSKKWRATYLLKREFR